MNNIKPNNALDQRKNKITVLFLTILLVMVFFLLSVLKTIVMERRVPSEHSTIHDRSFRGSIISADHYTLSSSYKSYQAIVRAESIDPNKKELFIKLFSIYSGIDENEVRAKFKDKHGNDKKRNIVLSRTINARSAMQLKSLAYKLRQLDVFQSIKIRAGVEVLYGLDILENGEIRRFPLKDIMSPILGYVGKVRNEKEDYVRPQGKKGLERYYNEHITSKKNGYIKGKRDVVGAVIHDKNSITEKRVDGLDLHLNISLDVQRRAELMIDNMQNNIDAQEILLGIMESKTGKLLALASTERFNPAHITQKDVPALNPKFSEYPHEAGSVIKPITLAVAIDHGKVTPNSWFNTFNGRMKIGKGRTITDDHKFSSLSARDIIVHSSNVGISQISWRITGQQFREGFLKFGIAKPSGLDLSRDLPGTFKPLTLLNNQMHRANSSYGYGMMVTFSQLMKAYSAFNNDGVAVTPRIVSYLQDKKGAKYTLKPEVGDIRPISKKTADHIKNILIEVVQRGTGKKAKYAGLEVGGKTGTAHIAERGRYVRKYHSSFYGFVNDKHGNKYTIGVLVIKAKKYRKYFASQSAVPTFKKAMDILVELDYLKPKEQPQSSRTTTDHNRYNTVVTPIVPRRTTSSNRTVQKPKPKWKPRAKAKVKSKPKPKWKPKPKVKSKPKPKWKPKPKVKPKPKPKWKPKPKVKPKPKPKWKPKPKPKWKPKPKVKPKPKWKPKPKPKPKPKASSVEDLF